MAIASLFGVVALPIVLIGILLPVALVVALQVWLCRRKNRWLGLILPVLSLLFSLLLVFSITAFTGMSAGSGGTVVEENGQVIQETVTENGITTVYDGQGNVLAKYRESSGHHGGDHAYMGRTILSVGLLFLLANIPTVVLGGIWLHYRNRRDFQDEFRRMNIQDLE